MKENTNLPKFELNQYTSALKEGILNFLVPLISLIVTVVLFALVIYPSFKELPALEEDLQTKKLLFERLDKKVVDLEKLSASKDTVNSDLTLLSNILVSEELVPQLLTQITQIGTEAGLAINRLTYSITSTATPTAPATVDSVAASLEEPTSNLSSVNVTLGASGDYNQVVNFLKTMENSARLLSVSSFRFTGTSADETIGGYEFTFILNSPYLTVKSDAVTDDAIALDISSREHIDFMNKMNMFKLYRITLEDIDQELLSDLSVPVEESTESVIPDPNLPQNQPLEIPAEEQ